MLAPLCRNPADLPSMGTDSSECGIPASWLTLPPGLCEPDQKSVKSTLVVQKLVCHGTEGWKQTNIAEHSQLDGPRTLSV